jgi:hypothetical protein
VKSPTHLYVSKFVSTVYDYPITYRYAKPILLHIPSVSAGGRFSLALPISAAGIYILFYYLAYSLIHYALGT